MELKCIFQPEQPKKLSPSAEKTNKLGVILNADFQVYQICNDLSNEVNTKKNYRAINDNLLKIENKKATFRTSKSLGKTAYLNLLDFNKNLFYNKDISYHKDANNNHYKNSNHNHILPVKINNEQIFYKKKSFNTPEDNHTDKNFLDIEVNPDKSMTKVFTEKSQMTQFCQEPNSRSNIPNAFNEVSNYNINNNTINFSSLNNFTNNIFNVNVTNNNNNKIDNSLTKNNLLVQKNNFENKSTYLNNSLTNNVSEMLSNFNSEMNLIRNLSKKYKYKKSMERKDTFKLSTNNYDQNFNNNEFKFISTFKNIMMPNKKMFKDHNADYKHERDSNEVYKNVSNYNHSNISNSNENNNPSSLMNSKELTIINEHNNLIFDYSKYNVNANQDNFMNKKYNKPYSRSCSNLLKSNYNQNKILLNNILNSESDMISKISNLHQQISNLNSNKGNRSLDWINYYDSVCEDEFYSNNEQNYEIVILRPFSTIKSRGKIMKPKTKKYDSMQNIFENRLKNFNNSQKNNKFNYNNNTCDNNIGNSYSPNNNNIVVKFNEEVKDSIQLKKKQSNSRCSSSNSKNKSNILTLTF